MEKLLEKLIDFVTKENIVKVLFYIALCLMSILTAIVIYDAKIIDLIHMHVLSGSHWSELESLLLTIILINLILIILYVIIHKLGLQLKSYKQAITWYNVITKFSQFTLAAASALYCYDALAYYNRYRAFRVGVFPVPDALAYLALFIGVFFILSPLVIKVQSRVDASFRKRTHYCDDNEIVICINDTITYCNKVYRVEEVSRVTPDGHSKMAPILTIYSGDNIALEDAAKNGGMKIIPWSW